MQPIISREELFALRDAVHSVTRTLEAAEDASMPSTRQHREERFHAAVTHLRKVCEGLEARGITEEDIEHAHALEQNPNYREPVSLGHVIVDEGDLDYDLTESLDSSIGD